MLAQFCDFIAVFACDSVWELLELGLDRETGQPYVRMGKFSYSAAEVHAYYKNLQTRSLTFQMHVLSTF